MDPNWREQEKRNRKGILILCAISLVLLSLLFYLQFIH